MKNKALLIITLLFFGLSINAQSGKKFVIILDAGHGGKDPGNSYHGFVEKEIALATTLKVEKYLQKDTDIQVICTRKTDVFIELVDRPNVANKIDANLFVSIHCNSVKNSVPYGTETYVMGMSRLNTNFEVAKKENSVILLEKDYKTTYKGFDPNNPETLIGLKIMQEENLNNSINLASSIEDKFVNKLNRKSRGIKQEPIWVLDAAYMPSVLIELGFLSNKEEGSYLNSDEGQDQMAQAIAEALINYKNNYIGKESDSKEIVFSDSKKNQKQIVDTIKTNSAKPSQVDITENKTKSIDSTAIVFKVQIAASKKNIQLTPQNFKGLKDVTVIEENNIYKYLYGETTDYNQVKNNLEIAKRKGYTSAYILVFKNGNKITIEEALKEFN